MISGVQTIQSLKSQERIASFIKVFSIVVIILDLLFIMFIGEFEKVNKPKSMDQWFKHQYPTFYENLDIIGFRSNNSKDKNDFLRKFCSYVMYFLLSIYLENHFIYQ